MMPIRYYDATKEPHLKPSANLIDVSRATKWLSGDKEMSTKALADEQAAAAAELGKRHYISPEYAAVLTKAFLGRASKEAYKAFSESLPRHYDLPRLNEVRLIQDMPHLGYCCFAFIKLFKEDGTPYEVRLHYANFFAKISTTPGEHFFNMNGPFRGHMFFGVALSRQGREDGSFGLDRSIHHSGISFITPSPQKAMEHTIAMRTGVLPSVWQAILKQEKDALDAKKKMRDVKAA